MQVERRESPNKVKNVVVAKKTYVDSKGVEMGGKKAMLNTVDCRRQGSGRFLGIAGALRDS